MTQLDPHSQPCNVSQPPGVETANFVTDFRGFIVGADQPAMRLLDLQMTQLPRGRQLQWFFLDARDALLAAQQSAVQRLEQPGIETWFLPRGHQPVRVLVRIAYVPLEDTLRWTLTPVEQD